MTDESELTPDRADYLARTYVNGLVDEVLADGVVTGKRIPQAGHWAVRFRDHPYVEQAEAEGWSRDLRAAVKAEVKSRIMARKPYHEINDLMPPKDWIDHQRKNAARYTAADSWRKEIVEKWGSMDAYLSKGKSGGAPSLGSVMRNAFVQMQRSSPNRILLHEKPAVDLSKRMTGDRE